MNIKIIIGLSLIIASLFLGESKSIPIPKVISTDYNSILDLQKPSLTVEKEIGNIKEIVTSQSDREKLSIFHNEMGKRLVKYDNINTVHFENYYYNSAKESFDGKLANKYKDLGATIQKLIINTLGSDESFITKSEFSTLSSKMRGMAWVLLN